jgi:glycosyltransferase involved in cell wall biosynthesis
LVTPVFNAGKYIEQTIRSVLAPDYPSLDYFIVDGGSTDNSVEIIRKCEKQISGWMSEPDNGAGFPISCKSEGSRSSAASSATCRPRSSALAPDPDWRWQPPGGVSGRNATLLASYRNPGMSYLLFKHFVVGAMTLLLPPQRFYQLRDWYAGKQLGRFRNRLFRTSE